MEVLDPREFLSGGIFREKEFRFFVEGHGWNRYRGKPVLLQGCAHPMPLWAYLVLAARLVPVVKSLHYGEVRDPIPVMGRLGGDSEGNP